ncbi:MAG: alpha/beta hydrolase [Pseudomonadota bacterium]|nr:alpha/beta hydrolase [Pseudomonadota bacterium]
MSLHNLLELDNGKKIAFVKSYFNEVSELPGVMFLGGLRSDMEGTKACFLESLCKKKRINFIKFDYTGHGMSSGKFEDGCIGEWFADACEVFDKLTSGEQILVGSSMGGWISLLLAKKRSERLAGFTGIAAAPDFTENSMWASFSEQQREELTNKGRVFIPSDYSAEPLHVSKKLIDDGRRHLVLDSKLKFNFPVRLLQGMKDKDVNFKQAVQLGEHISCENLKVTLVKNADHQFSSEECLKILSQTVEELFIKVR